MARRPPSNNKRQTTATTTLSMSPTAAGYGKSGTLAGTGPRVTVRSRVSSADGRRGALSLSTDHPPRSRGSATQVEIETPSARPARTVQYPVAPTLKRAIVDVTPRQTLAKIVDVLGVTSPNRRSGAAMAQALVRARRARAEDLLQLIDDDTLHRACSIFQVRPAPQRARTIERLVATDVYRASGSEVALHTDGPFVAMSAWCADAGRDSLCALHLLRVDHGKVVADILEHIRPPRRRVVGPAADAGLDWTHLRGADRFATVWERVRPLFEDVAFIAAHNGAFLRSVLATSCAEARLPAPRIPVQCTSRLARRMWQLAPDASDALRNTLSAVRGTERNVPGPSGALDATSHLAAEVVLCAKRAAKR